MKYAESACRGENVVGVALSKFSQGFFALNKQLRRKPIVEPHRSHLGANGKQMKVHLGYVQIAE